MRHVERGYKLGKWLRRFRERQGMTQSMVAKTAGVTPACLSQLENDKRVATAPMLQRVLSAMNVHSLQDFFYAVERGEDPVHRVEDRVLVIGPDEPVRAEYIGPRTRNFDFYLMYIDMEPGYHKDSDDVVGDEKCIYVLEGKLGVTLDGEAHEMHPGEACFVHAYCPCRMCNRDDGNTRVLVVNMASPQRATDTLAPPSGGNI